MSGTWRGVILTAALPLTLAAAALPAQAQEALGEGMTIYMTLPALIFSLIFLAAAMLKIFFPGGA